MASGHTPTDHSGMEVLSSAETDRLLEATPVGRVAFIDEGEPVIFPVTYRYHRGSIVFRTAIGEKLDAAARNVPIAFEIDGWSSDDRTGWSVLVRGTAREVWDEAEIAELEALGLEPWADAVERDRWVRILPTEISGRRIRR